MLEMSPSEYHAELLRLARYLMRWDPWRRVLFRVNAFLDNGMPQDGMMPQAVEL